MAHGPRSLGACFSEYPVKLLWRGTPLACSTQLLILDVLPVDSVFDLAWLRRGSSELRNAVMQPGLLFWPILSPVWRRSRENNVPISAGTAWNGQPANEKAEAMSMTSRGWLFELSAVSSQPSSWAWPICRVSCEWPCSCPSSSCRSFACQRTPPASVGGVLHSWPASCQCSSAIAR